MSRNINQGFRSFVTAALVVILSACSSGGSSGSKSDDQSSPVENTDFSFAIEKPTFQDSTDQVSQLILPLLNGLKQIVVSKAFALDTVLTSDIYIVRVNAQGEVTAFIQPTTPITQQADNSYTVSIAEGSQPDIIIIIDINQTSDITIGKKLNAANYLYHPMVDDKAMKIDLGSSVAFDIFIEEIDDFSLISSAELNRIIDRAQKFLADAGLEEPDYASLLASIRASIANQVRTNTALAIKVDDSNVINHNNDATIEEDRASIKAFFDEANTLYSLRDEFVKLGNGESNDLDTLNSQGEQVAEALEQARTALSSLNTVELVLSDFVEGAQVTAQKQIKDISSLFSTDPLSKLTGTIEYDVNGASININGSYDEVTFDQVAASLTTNGNDTNFNLAGTIESPTAKLVISNGALIVNSDLASAGLLLTEQIQQTYADKINAFQLALELVLTTKADVPASFSGSFSISGIRSTENYIKFVGGEVEPIFNVKQAKLKGELSLANSHVKLDMELTSPNAATFIPHHQTYEAGKTYQDIVSYSYNGGDKFEIHTPNTDFSYSVESRDFNDLFVVEQNVQGNESSRFAYKERSFIENVQAQTFYFYIHSFSSFYISGSDLDVGEHAISKDVNGEIITVNYHLNSDTLSFSIETVAEIINASYTFNDDQTALVATKLSAKNVNRPWHNYNGDPIDFYSYNYASFVNYIKNKSFYVTLNNDCYSYYYVDGSSLVPGTQTITVNKNSWDNCAESPDSVDINYSLSDEEFIFDTDNKFDGYKKYRLHSHTNSTKNSIVKMRSDKEEGDENALYLNDGKAFTDYLTERFKLEDGCVMTYGEYCESTWIYVDGIGDLNSGYSSLEVGENHALTTFLYYVDDPREESENNFRLFDVKANLEVQLDVLGTTNISAELDRIGYKEALFTVSINNSDLQQTESGLSLLASIVGNETDQFVISNSAGISLNLADYDGEGDTRTLVYGKETATVTKTKIGLKVSFSDGIFHEY